MRKNKVVDLRTTRGKNIYEKLATFYTSMYYGIENAKSILYAEGYSHVITWSGEKIKL